MDINIDEDNLDSDYGTENEIYVDEPVEVAEVSEVDIRPKETGSQPPPIKKSRAKTIIAVIVIVMIILAVILAYIFIPKAPTNIELFATESGDGNALRLNAIVGSESATEVSGTAKISISFDGDEVYSNDNWKIDSNDEKKEIPYNEFAVANGIYTVNVEFEGVEDEATYELDFVVEDISIDDEALVLNPNIPSISGQPEFTLRVILETAGIAKPKSTEIKIVEIIHEDNVNKVTSGIGEWEDVSGEGFFQDTFDYDESGNYTVTIGIKNTDLKSSSSFYEFERVDTFMINAQPKAEITTSEDPDNSINRGDTVTFYSHESIDDSENNNKIIEYKWYFTDTKQTEYGIEVNHQFNILNTDPDENGMWMVTLTITDNGDGGEQKTHTDFVLIEVNP
jgi:hypothetical protein